MNTSTGIDPNADSDSGSDDEDFRRPPNWARPTSPAGSSASGLASSLVQRVGNLVGGISPGRSNTLPSDAELEAEAERERERSRREAEAILKREAQQKQLEQRMMAAVDNARGLPPPPTGQRNTSTNPSPTSSHKESSSWWQAAKNRLTPTKDKDSKESKESKDNTPLTPAQQVIMDAKAKELNHTPSLSSLNIPLQPPTRKPVPASPSSPTPSRPSLSTPNLSPSPMRTSDSLANSPSREAPPTYAQFNAQGTLDVPGTLLAIAKRFEKLEKWTIGHVRALEDRMNDVERWLVEKEGQKEESAQNSSGGVQQEIGELREEISELQGRVGELGREMAKLATAPSNLSSGPKSQVASINHAPRQASSTPIHESLEASVAEVFHTPRHTRLSSSARESTSPPLASAKSPSGTRLPYPTGDYNAPDDLFSPTGSPSASLNSSSRKKSLSTSGAISGLPPSSLDSPLSSVFNIASTLGVRPMSPPTTSGSPKPPSTPTTAGTGRRESNAGTGTPSGNNSLPAPKQTQKRTGSVSPTPRKRYTVALGGPIVAPPDLEPEASETTTKRTARGAKGRQDKEVDESEDEDDDLGGETIGKSASAKIAHGLAKKKSNASLNSVTSMSSVDKEVYAAGTAAMRYTAKMGNGGGDKEREESRDPVVNNPSLGSSRRMKAQSVYGMSSFMSPAHSSTTSLSSVTDPKKPLHKTSTDTINTTAPLRLRSKSSEKLNGGDANNLPPVTPTSAKFVDPLLLRRKQEVAAGTQGHIAAPKPTGKLAVNQLVAFFDKDKDKRRR